MVCVVCAGLVLPRLPKAALPLAVGTVGALIMPHNMYLQSAVVQSRSVSHICSCTHSLTYLLTHPLTHSLTHFDRHPAGLPELHEGSL